MAYPFQQTAQTVPVLALIVAGGRGIRAGGGQPKQYRLLAGRPVLTRTLERFLGEPAIAAVQVVIHPDDLPAYEAAVAALPKGLSGKLLAPVMGGATRCLTVRNGLAALEEWPESTIMLIHDAARPFVTSELIAASIAAGLAHRASVPAVAVTDTIKRVDAQGVVRETVPRDELRRVQTPQAFELDLIAAIHAKAAAAGLDDASDDGALVEWAGEPLHIHAGDPANMKLTTEEDFVAAEARLRQDEPMLTRVATGYDVHAFGPGDRVWLCGVAVPHDQGVLAHSDGDVALHALCDALFGALGDGDIGTHFPPSDMRWKGASSDQFVAHACQLLAERGGVIDHLDISIVCERPKIGPYRDAMRARLAAIAGVGLDQVGLKATTSERLGFTGRSEGLAALATVTVRLPRKDREHG